VLATSLVDSLNQDHQNAPPVPTAPNYREEFAQIVAEGLGFATDVAAEGLGIRNRRGRRGGQGRGNRPQPVPDARRPAHPQSTQERLPACYGRLAVVSDVDDGGFALNVDKELRGSAVL
jgi:hypothetical protein